MERLQKVLAQAGIASRRAAEQIILAGRVRVDGKIVRELGTHVDPRKSRVEVDGNTIVAEKLVYLVLHKPRGVVCTLSDPEGHPTIRELLKETGARVVPVGRLDFHTSGALLCTNDGEFAQALAHPKREVPKVYVAKVKGAVDDDALERFGERVMIDGRPTQPAQVKRLRFEGDKTWLEITLREGRNRQVRKLGEATGFPVMRLARISHAGVNAEDLRPGQWRHLTLDELVALKRDFGVPQRVRSPGTEAWEIQVKSNARVPRVGVAKRAAEDPRARREAPSGKPRPAPKRGERREFTGKDRFTRDRVADPREVRAAKRPATSNARPERSNARPERSNARPERSNARSGAHASARPERANSRPERPNTRPERANARP